MIWISLFLICLFAGAVGGSIVANSKNEKDEEENTYDIWDKKDEIIPFKIKIKDVLKKSDVFLQLIMSSFKETAKEIKKSKVRK